MLPKLKRKKRRKDSGLNGIRTLTSAVLGPVSQKSRNFSGLYRVPQLRVNEISFELQMETIFFYVNYIRCFAMLLKQ